MNNKYVTSMTFCICIILTMVSFTGCVKNYTPEELSSNVGTYLDAGYTQKWAGASQPDLTKLNWTTKYESVYIRNSANLTVYLENNNRIPVFVFVDWSKQEIKMGDIYFPNDSIINGWWVSSDNVTLNPKQKAPMTIYISYSDYAPIFKSMGNLGELANENQMIYFHIYQRK